MNKSQTSSTKMKLVKHKNQRETKSEQEDTKTQTPTTNTENVPGLGFIKKHSKFVHESFILTLLLYCPCLCCHLILL